MYKNVSNKWEENVFNGTIPVLEVYFDNVLIESKYVTSIKPKNTLFKQLELGSTPCQRIGN